jgi:signal peptidase
MVNEFLAPSIDAFHRGDLATARYLLKLALARHREDEEVWLWMSRVANRPAEKMRCLRRVLAINPENRIALSGLLILSPKHEMSKRRSAAMRHLWHWFHWVQNTGGWVVFAISVVLLSIVAVATVPMFVGGRTFAVMSGSMEPTIPEGAAIVTQPVASKDLKVGDIIVFSPSATAEMPFVHRIVSVRDHHGTRYFTTRGDANDSGDVGEISLPQTAWRLWYSVPMAGYVISLAVSRVGTILLILVPVLGLVGLAGLDWLRRGQRVRHFSYTS